MQRITAKDFRLRFERLEASLGMKLLYNDWLNHKSVYTQGENGSCKHLLVQSDTYSGACAQISAIQNVLYVLNKRDEK